MKSSIKIVFVIIASFIGAGFASGKEIYSFFYIYGIKGIAGIIISSCIISLIIYRVFDICYKNKINSYLQFCEYIVKDKKFTASILNNIVNIFVLITFFVMIAGFASLLEQELHLDKIIGACIIIILNYIVSMKSINGLIKLSNYLVPIFILFFIIIMLKNSNYLNIFMYSQNDIMENIEVNLLNNWISKSVLYASYNCVVLIPVIVMMSQRIKNKKIFSVVSLANLFTLILLSLSVYSLLLIGDDSIYKLQMPIIAIVQKYGHIYKLIYILLIAISIFTTATSSGVSFLNNTSKNTTKFKRNLFYISILAIPLAQISFGTLVECLYPVLGIIGMLEIIIILKASFTDNKPKIVLQNY